MPRAPKSKTPDRAASLHLAMRPLSPGALEPVRRQSHVLMYAVIVACTAVLLVFVAPMVFFFSVFGDPYGRGFVEQREDGLYAQLRACEGDTVHTVSVAPYDERTEQPAPIWTATSSSPRGAVAVKLFGAQPQFDVSATDVTVPLTFEVTINKGLPSASWVVVDRVTLDPGDVEFGGDRPTPRADYEAMHDSEFGCPP